MDNNIRFLVYVNNSAIKIQENTFDGVKKNS